MTKLERDETQIGNIDSSVWPETTLPETVNPFLKSIRFLETAAVCYCLPLWKNNVQLGVTCALDSREMETSEAPF